MLSIVWSLLPDNDWWALHTHPVFIPMQIKPNKSPLRNRLLALLLWEINHLSSPSRSRLGRLILIHGGRGGGQGGSVGGALPETLKPIYVLWWYSICRASIPVTPAEKERTLSRGGEGTSEPDLDWSPLFSNLWDPQSGLSWHWTKGKRERCQEKHSVLEGWGHHKAS